MKNVKILRIALIVLSALIADVGCVRGENKSMDKFTSIRWIDYTPTNADPDQGVEPTEDSIREDLMALRRAQFTGLVTYSSSGIIGAKLVSLAAKAGFQGMILGIWDPANANEIANAKEAAKSPIVLGISIGNEGLMNNRYQISLLASAIKDVRQTTGKPVTTTEIAQKYFDTPELTELGDWIFPTAHPYFSNRIEPRAAITWTEVEYKRLRAVSKRFVMLKEVGLPTAGGASEPLSEAAQCEYYTGLARTDVRFVYFEAFDQPWKRHRQVEPHWGLFTETRIPKVAAMHLVDDTGCSQVATRAVAQIADCALSPENGDIFYVYRDNGANNHFTPSGYMGDTGDIHVRYDWENNPQSGTTSIRVEYTGRGSSPTCDNSGPCKWAGVYWQQPPLNWGKTAAQKCDGFNLSRFRSLRFWARADRMAVVEFKVGGIAAPFGDSLRSARGLTATLTPEWKEYTLDLHDADLHHLIGGFAVVLSKDRNPIGATFYLDNIRFETN